MNWVLALFIGFIAGGVVVWFVKPDKTTVDKEAVKDATQKLDKGSTDLKQEVDKHHL